MAHVTFFKESRPSGAVQRKLRKLERDNAEDRAKAQVRRRDKGCRFPLCGCRKLGLALEVSHNEHKGMGGNPRGDRSTTELMMQLCRERHQTNPVSLHKGRVWWEPLDRRLGANGPVRWLMDAVEVRRLSTVPIPSRSTAVVFAIEQAVGVPAIVAGFETVVLRLAEMDL